MNVNQYEGAHQGAGMRFAIVASRFNELITERLVDGARSCLLQHGVSAGDVDLVRVPGAFELPAAVAALLRRGGYDGVIALGCVIRGETSHYDFVAGEASRGLQELSLRYPVGLGFGLLTTDTQEQAVARAGGDRGNKGWEAALTALEMVDLIQHLEPHAGA